MGNSLSCSQVLGNPSSKYYDSKLSHSVAGIADEADDAQLHDAPFDMVMWQNYDVKRDQRKLLSSQINNKQRLNCQHWVRLDDCRCEAIANRLGHSRQTCSWEARAYQSRRQRRRDARETRRSVSVRSSSGVIFRHFSNGSRQQADWLRKPVSNFHTTWPNHADADRLRSCSGSAPRVAN